MFATLFLESVMSNESVKVKHDDEVLVMGRLVRQFESMDPGKRRRVLNYLNERFGPVPTLLEEVPRRECHHPGFSSMGSPSSVG